MNDDERLKKIAEIIEAVDRRCETADVVTSTLKEMTDGEISYIYFLAKRESS